MKEEPLWRTVLYWGATIVFLFAPLTVFSLHFAADELHWEFSKHINDYKGLAPSYQTLTALIFGLCGLRSIDKYVETKNGNAKKEEPKKSINQQSVDEH
jgi:hypothetical protein